MFLLSKNICSTIVIIKIGIDQLRTEILSGRIRIRIRFFLRVGSEPDPQLWLQPIADTTQVA